MTKEEARKKAAKEFGGYKITPVKESAGAFAFLCESPSSDIVPNKMIVAVNKTTGKIGMSMFSTEQAIQQSLS